MYQKNITAYHRTVGGAYHNIWMIIIWYIEYHTTSIGHNFTAYYEIQLRPFLTITLQYHFHSVGHSIDMSTLQKTTFALNCTLCDINIWTWTLSLNGLINQTTQYLLMKKYCKDYQFRLVQFHKIFVKVLEHFLQMSQGVVMSLFFTVSSFNHTPPLLREIPWDFQDIYSCA